jgi:hypothetical protein
MMGGPEPNSDPAESQPHIRIKHGHKLPWLMINELIELRNKSEIGINIDIT